MTFASSYDPSEDEDDEPKRPARQKRNTSRSNGPRKPRMWVEVDEDGEPLPLDEKQAAKLRERAQNLCLWHLGQGPRTRKQLTDAMTKHGVPVDMSESVLAKLEEYNYVNDKSFADNYVRSRHEGQQHKGASAIRYELIRKGVDADTIAEALEQVTPESEMENARVLVAKKLASTRRLERQKRVNRLVGMLARKGYPPGVAYQVVKEAIDAEDPEDEDWDSR
jgi:regulatory protein